MLKRHIAARSLYRLVILMVALVLVVTSVTDGLLHIVEFISLDGRPSSSVTAAVGMQVLSPTVAAIVLLLLLGRDWGAATRAEEKAAAADERAAIALRRLDEAIECIDQGFALFDADDRLVYCNSRFREMYPQSAPFLPGVSFEELIRRSAVRGHFADCDPRAPDAWIAGRLQSHRSATGPIEQRLSDGRWLRVDERRTADGGNVGLRTDITETRRRQADLAAKSAMFEATLGAMVQGVLVWDEHRRLAAFNRQVQALLETPEGLLRPGLSLEAFLTYLVERGEFGPGDPPTLMRRRLAQLLEAKGGCIERRRPNGRTVEVRSIPVAGGLTLITYIDVTEQRAAEAQLRESEERFRKLSDSAMEGILAHEGGVIVDANRAAGELLRLPAEEMIGKHLNDFIAPEWHEAILARLARREETRTELTCIRRDGRTILVEAQNRYVQHRGRSVSMVSFRDVTEQRQGEALLRGAKDAAELASRSKNDFVRTVSHELRTPMNGVLGMLELLQDAGLPEPLRAYAATAYASANTMLGLLDDLLDFSKIEAGRLSLDTAAFNAAETVMAAAETVAARAAAKSLSLAVCIPAGADCRVVSDVARLRQVLLNLVGNAVKFTDRGGVAILVEADRLDLPGGGEVPALRFEVRDSGIGIAPAALPQLFSEFVQVHDDANHAVGGTGLGLAISRRLVELMGGRIGVESVAGEGSRFWFIVPTGREDVQQESGAAASPLPAGCRAVVIDASPVTGQATARQIAGWGAEVATYSDMAQAAAWLGEAGRRLSALLAGAGVPSSGPPPKGAAVAALLRGGRLRCVVVRPMGASIPPLHPQTAALDWPAGPEALLAALTGEGEEQPSSPPLSSSAPSAPFPSPLPTIGRLLLAEDGETNQMVASAFLERAGYEVICAVNGREAVEAAEGMTFDAILMDVGMPVMDGLEATRRIRALPPPAGTTPIIALTADAAAEDRQRCLNSGMNDHLAKPLERGQLLATVARWIKAAQDAARAPEAPNAAGPVDESDVLDMATLTQLERDLDSEMLDSLVRQFLDEAAGRIDRVASLGDNPSLLRREAHTLKSTAATFGARKLCAAARELETACAEDAPPPPGLCAGLPELLEEAAAAYRRIGRLG
jgi:two-component system, sensor histidine kinase and response regulator